MKTILIVQDNNTGEMQVWATLTAFCRNNDFSHNYLKRLNAPFVYRGLTVNRYEIKSKNRD